MSEKHDVPAVTKTPFVSQTALAFPTGKTKEGKAEKFFELGHSKVFFSLCSLGELMGELKQMTA